MTKKDLRQTIVDWNIKFPIDRWWREKHKIPFMSERHKQSSFIHQYFEFTEDKLYHEQANRKESDYTPNQGEYLKIENVNEPLAPEDMMDELRRELAEFNKTDTDG